MLARISNRGLATVLGLVGLGITVATTALDTSRVPYSLGVEAGFTVLLIGYLFARSAYGFREALVSMAPGLAAHAIVLERQNAAYAWLGVELVVVAASELAWMGMRYLTAKAACGSVDLADPPPRSALCDGCALLAACHGEPDRAAS